MFLKAFTLLFFQDIKMINLGRLLIWTQLIIFTGYLAHGDQLNWGAHKPKYCLNDDNFTRTNDDPIRVYAGISLTAIFDVDESKMEFGIQIFLRALWKEPLLGLEGVNLTETQVIPVYISECIWHPDLIFPNAKSCLKAVDNYFYPYEDAYLYDVTLPNMVLKLQKNGYIYKYGRYKLLLICNMVFKIYPMDTQFCTLDIGFSSRNKEARLDWLEECKDNLGKNLKIYTTIEPMKFSLKNIKVLKETFLYTSGNTTILKVLFEFYRPITASLINTYVPSFMVVCLSWVSFWLDANAVPGRVTLGVTALLTLATQIVHARAGLPSLSYMTAIDIWLFGCLVMVFVSLIEFTMVQTCSRKNTRLNVTNVPTCSRMSNSSLRNLKEIQLDEHSKQCRQRSSSKNATSVYDFKKDNIDVTKGDFPLDRASRIIFPLVMLIFSTIYWSYFLHLASKANYHQTNQHN